MEEREGGYVSENKKVSKCLLQILSFYTSQPRDPFSTYIAISASVTIPDLLERRSTAKCTAYSSLTLLWDFIYVWMLWAGNVINLSLELNLLDTQEKQITTTITTKLTAKNMWVLILFLQNFFAHHDRVDLLNVNTFLLFSFCLTLERLSSKLKWYSGRTWN